jgi:multidrug efflux pump subunit AcrA (membrane-fusion protein)
MQEKLFRKSALDRLASPERLDVLIQIVSFKAWLVPFAALGLIAAALFWGLTGRVPITISGQGILLHGGRIDTLESPVAGLLVALSVQPGDVIHKQALVGQVSQPLDGELVPITSPFEGQVLETRAREGAYLQPGTPVLRLEPVGEPLVAVLFVSPADGKKLAAGMTVHLLPSTVRQEEYGYLLGTITYVSPLPMSTESIVEVLGNAGLAQQLSPIPNPVEVFVSLQPSESNPSHYEWTSSRRPDTILQGGTFIRGRVILNVVRPIDLMFSNP